MVSETSVAGAMFFWNHCPLQSPPFSGRFADRPHRRLRHRLFFSCCRIQVRHLCRTSGRALRNSGTQLSHPESKPYKRKKWGWSSLSANNVSRRLHLPRPCPPQRTRRKNGRHLRLRTGRSRTGGTFTKQSQADNGKTLPHARPFIGIERTETYTRSSHPVRQ